MTRNRRIAIGLALGVVPVIVLGFAFVAAAQFDLGMLRQQYETRKEKLDENNSEEIYRLARWCYENGLKDEAKEHALQAHQKAPEDTRPKYLYYVLAGGTEGPEDQVVALSTQRPEITVTDANVERVFKEEGAPALNKFKSIQPMLFGRCGRPQCHGGKEAGGLVLIKQAAASRKVLVQNFLAVNRYVNREEPTKSPLLEKPLGGQDSGHPQRIIRNEQEAVYHLIRQWIESLKTESDRLWDEADSGEGKPAFPEE